MIDFNNLPRGHFGAILADPPWRFRTWNNATSIVRRGGRGTNVSAAVHYGTMLTTEIESLQVSEVAAQDCCLFLWVTWPMLIDGMNLIRAWGFEYKTCAFAWMKADVSTIDMFSAPKDADMKLGYWTRSNSEVCLLGTRGKPKRLQADVRQGIIEPARQHSRKPDCVHQRIERLVAGPYLELFARAERNGWKAWGNETTKFTQAAE